MKNLLEALKDLKSKNKFIRLTATYYLLIHLTVLLLILNLVWIDKRFIIAVGLFNLILVFKEKLESNVKEMEEKEFKKLLNKFFNEVKVRSSKIVN